MGKAEKRSALTIAGVRIPPGGRGTVDLPVGHLYTHTEMTVPAYVIHGRREGPCLFISAALHGDELTGIEVIRRLLKLKTLQRVRGTLIAIPVVNVYGFITRTRYLPDRRDLNRLFPGSEKGSLAARVARTFFEKIASLATHGIDIHAGSAHRENLPQLRVSLDDPEAERLARAFGAPVIVDANLRDGSLREAVAGRGIPMLLYEAGEALRFDELSIRTGVRGVLAVMREIGMLRTRAPRATQLEPIIARSTGWVRAPVGGVLFRRAALGTRVRSGDILGTIGDPFGETEVDVIADRAGVIIGRLNLPLVHEGDAIFHVASVERGTRVGKTLDTFQDLLEEEYPEEEIET